MNDHERLRLLAEELVTLCDDNVDLAGEFTVADLNFVSEVRTCLNVPEWAPGPARTERIVSLLRIARRF